VPRHYPALAAEMAAGLELLRITSRTASVVAIGPSSLTCRVAGGSSECNHLIGEILIFATQ